MKRGAAAADDLAERRARDVAVDGAGAVELRVIEDVERLEPELRGAATAERARS